MKDSFRSLFATLKLMTSSYRDDFAFKLSAAKYHIEQIHKTYTMHRELFEVGKDCPEIRPIFYHYHAVVYELCSAMEMILQLINDQEQLSIDADKVVWRDDQSSKFQRKLLEKNPQAYSLVSHAYAQEWSSALRETRNHSLHRGLITLQIEYSEEGLNILDPVIDEKIFHFDINLWGEEVSNLFDSLYKG